MKSRASYLLCYTILFFLFCVKFILKDSFDNGLFGAATALILTTFFSHQKQKLEEFKFSNQLFKEFNERYDSLNDDLNSIVQRCSIAEINEEQKQKLYDYFNLCAEEYYQFKENHIPYEIWNNWVNGMKFFYSQEKIRELWKSELKYDSYYGFTPKLLES